MENRASIPAKEPVEFELEPGKVYSWCKCGKSGTQPFCDDISHQGTGIEPKKFTVSVKRKAWLCMCKQTKTHPYCDGSHRNA
ncbi:CDGSH iron-sulfur domain-containing protein [Ohtaekwangia sp.]|uniref:CDGSH iron-sulfur domain-containing protein n=1 Tax=Ohtaekwangia sp. TaxID=2066019 RepID=UPI002F92019A